MRILSALILAGALALGACNRHDEPEEAPLANNLVTPPDENVTEAPPEEPANVVQNKTPPAAPPPTIAEEEQMRDDADASGLTTRLPDDEGGAGQTGNQTRPAE